MNAETRAKLASLGYVAPAQSTSGTKSDPKTVAPLFRAFEEATAMLNAGRARDAAAPLEQLVRADPTNHVFRETLARALKQNGDAARAIALNREAVAIISGHEELVANWMTEHAKWLDEKRKWESDAEHNMRDH